MLDKIRQYLRSVTPLLVGGVEVGISDIHENCSNPQESLGNTYLALVELQDLGEIEIRTRILYLCEDEDEDEDIQNMDEAVVLIFAKIKER